MTEYDYTGKTTAPNLDGIHAGVASSAMTNKSIAYCVWTESGALLRIYWQSALSTGDKIILDDIVTANS